MNETPYTLVSNWYIVDVIDGDSSLGKVLWCICEEDFTLRFEPGQYICSSRIVKIEPSKRLIETSSASLYKLVDDGQSVSINVTDFELLRAGYSPDQIQLIKRVNLSLQEQ